MPRSLSVVSGVLLAAVALRAAIELHAQPLEAGHDDMWLDRLNELKCQEPDELDRPSLNQPLLAMIGSCRRVRAKAPSDGPYSVVALNVATGELRAARISAVWSGGLHHTQTGDVIWFSEMNGDLLGERQRFLEAFSLAPESSVERSLGRIELPFVAGNTTLVKGGNCHVLRMQSRFESSGVPVERRHWLFDDGRPTESGRMLEGIAEVLYFEPRNAVFVVELARPDSSAEEATEHAVLDCSQRVAPLDAELASRLGELEGGRRFYRAAVTGDLLVDVYDVAAGGPLLTDDHSAGPRTVLFRGSATTTFPPLIDCELVVDELWCYAHRISSLGWSPSGDHFALRQPSGVVQIYRTTDLGVVYERPIDLNRRVLFMDDAAVYVHGKRRRLERYAWH